MIIYKTTNSINGKFYIGKDSFNDPTYLGSGVILKRSIKKYGIENFRKEILEYCSSREKLDEREVYWIKELKSTDRNVGYNIAIGGTGGDTYTYLSEESKTIRTEKWRESAKETMKSDEVRKKHSEIMHKRWEDPVERQRMSDTMRGREITWKDKISASNKEHYRLNPPVISEETKSKISKKMKGFEFKQIPETLKDRVKKLYESCGPILISETLKKENFDVSPYIIRRFLKKEGVYKKYQKGIGDVKFKVNSIKRSGKNNPMWGHTQTEKSINKRKASIKNTLRMRDVMLRNFYNKVTGEEYVGTAYDFREKYNISYFSVRKLIKQIVKSTNGWELKSNV